MHSSNACLRRSDLHSISWCVSPARVAAPLFWVEGVYFFSSVAQTSGSPRRMWKCPHPLEISTYRALGPHRSQISVHTRIKMEFPKSFLLSPSLVSKFNVNATLPASRPPHTHTHTRTQAYTGGHFGH